MKQFSPSSAAPLLPLDLWLPGMELLRDVPAELAGWLTEAGPLTGRIRAAAGTTAGIRVLEERLGFLSGEQQALLAAPVSSCLVREAELTARGRAWIYVEALIPDHTLELHPWLAELGDSPLDATLAGVAGLTRGPYEFAPLPAVHPLAARAIARLAEEPDILWARRAWFALRGRRLLVQEVFLPDLGQC